MSAKTDRPKAAKRQGVRELDLVDARGSIVGWDGEHHALVEFVYGGNGEGHVVSVPITNLTYVDNGKP